MPEGTGMFGSNLSPDIFALIMDRIGSNIAPKNPMSGIGTALSQSKIANQARQSSNKMTGNSLTALLQALGNPTDSGKDGLTTFTSKAGKTGGKEATIKLDYDVPDIPTNDSTQGQLNSVKSQSVAPVNTQQSQPQQTSGFDFTEAIKALSAQESPSLFGLSPEQINQIAERDTGNNTLKAGIINHMFGIKQAEQNAIAEAANNKVKNALEERKNYWQAIRDQAAATNDLTKAKQAEREILKVAFEERNLAAQAAEHNADAQKARMSTLGAGDQARLTEADVAAKEAQNIHFMPGVSPGSTEATIQALRGANTFDTKIGVPPDKSNTPSIPFGADVTLDDARKSTMYKGTDPKNLKPSTTVDRTKLAAINRANQALKNGVTFDTLVLPKTKDNDSIEVAVQKDANGNVSASQIVNDLVLVHKYSIEEATKQVKL